ncbi:MAG: hypothetical protein IT463_09905 [Planctomycetes bacterium]|nr:hypothetical protein [Planctomycetota bacterium]
MRNIFAAAVLSICVTSLYAGGAVIEQKDGKSETAYSIELETISGVSWSKARNNPGAKVDLWNVEHVKYNGKGMDEYNGLARKLAAGRGKELAEHADLYLKMAAAPQGVDDESWARVKLACRYYRGQGLAMTGQDDAAVDELDGFIKDAEAQAVEGGLNLKFTSAVSSKPVAKAGGLHRLYLDGLEALGLALLRKGESAKATDTAFKALEEISKELASKSGKNQYFNWALRALRVSARYAEDRKEYAAARQAYESLAKVALQKEGGRASRASNEASLRVGFMQIKEGDVRGASSRFFEAIREWEAAYGPAHDPNTNPPAFKPNWITPDISYRAAGAYVGQGMVEAAQARNSQQWAKALKNFCTSLAIFDADDEIRSMGLLGAANAAAQLAEQSKGNAVVASNYAKLAEKYLAELTGLFGKSKAAEDDQIAVIQSHIRTYKKD